MNKAQKRAEANQVTLSIVSHGQANLIRPLLVDLNRLVTENVEVILTINIPEDESHYLASDLPLRIVRNGAPKGFGANHNAAFRASRGNFFAVVNPDIRIPKLDLRQLLAPFKEHSVGACAPLVRDSTGQIQNSARRFPTWPGLFSRLLFRSGNLDYQAAHEPLRVDWIAGMFAVYRREAFEQVRGFDDRRYYMYMEDVDLCARLWREGWSVLFQPQTEVIHDAQFASHRNLQHLRWHATSMFRYLSGV